MVQLVRTPACHAGGRGFKSLLGRHYAPSFLGKDEVASSNLAISSRKTPDFVRSRAFFELSEEVYFRSIWISYIFSNKLTDAGIFA